MILPPPDAIKSIDLHPTAAVQRACYTNTDVDATVLTNSIGLSLKYEVIRLSEESYGRFMLILNSPVSPNENLRQAIQKYKG